MRLLALDIGTKRTGVAFLDETIGVPFPLMTIHHDSTQELIKSLRPVVTERKVDRFLIGLPLLPSGEEGLQSGKVRETASMLLGAFPLPFSFIDERYTTMDEPDIDKDTAAACLLFQSM